MFSEKSIKKNSLKVLEVVIKKEIQSSAEGTSRRHAEWECGSMGAGAFTHVYRTVSIKASLWRHWRHTSIILDFGPQAFQKALTISL